MERALAPILGVVEGTPADSLASPTPCAEWDVRDLVGHLLLWGPALEGAARKELVAARPEVPDADLVALAAQLRATVAAWSEPAAWEGLTRLGSPETMPADLIGGMVLGELVVHGWDLAQATGQVIDWDDAVLSRVHSDLLGTAPMGRDMGIYATEVPVPADAPLLDRILGLTGRAPSPVTTGPAPLKSTIRTVTPPAAASPVRR